MALWSALDYGISGFQDCWDCMDYMDVQNYMLTRSDPSPPGRVIFPHAYV